jgi:hypothetical protein
MECYEKTEEVMGMKYGDPDNALLVSCRSELAVQCQE